MADLFDSWEDFLRGTSERDVVAWCHEKAKAANRVARPRLDKLDVLGVLLEAEGRCHWCASLAVNKRTEVPQGLGDRVGSLDHVLPADLGGRNSVDNLVWSCMLCNSARGYRGGLPFDIERHGSWPAARAHHERRLIEQFGSLDAAHKALFGR